MRLSHILLFLLVFLTACSTCSWARAEIAVWQDPDTGVSLHYPDRWARVHDQGPDDVFTVAAPGLTDFAACRMRVRDDSRFLTYPRVYAVNIQHKNYAVEFWKEYLAEYDNAKIAAYADGGFGRGFGSVIEATFRPSVGTKIWKKGLMAAAPYYDKLYILECSSSADSFARWAPGFANIMRSVDFEKIIHDHMNGEYRSFTCDPRLRIHGRMPQDMYIQ